jgi:hypothetical protein
MSSPRYTHRSAHTSCRPIGADHPSSGRPLTTPQPPRSPRSELATLTRDASRGKAHTAPEPSIPNRDHGFEPRLPGSEPGVLPLDEPRADHPGFEPGTARLTAGCSTD